MEASRRLRAAFRAPMFRNAAQLSSGTALGQAISVIATPILARVYNPADFGELALFTSLVVVAGSVAALRFEQTVMLPRSDDEGERAALDIVVLSLVTAVVTSSVFFLMLVALRAWLGIYSHLGPWLYVVPLAGFLTSVMVTLGAYATRERLYGALSRIPITRNVSVALLQTGFGLTIGGGSGLILGYMATPLVGTGILSRQYIGRWRALNHHFGGRRRLRELAVRYSDFPKYSVWGALANALVWNVQPLLIARFYNTAATGSYSLALTVVGAPMAVIVVGIAQVYQRECADVARDSASALQLARRTFRVLALVSLPLFGGLTVAILLFFDLLFGPEWAQAKVLSLALIPLFLARFLSVPLSSTLLVFRRQRRLLWWQLGLLVLTVAVFAGGGAAGWELTWLVLVCSLVLAPIYLAILPMCFTAIRSGLPESQDEPATSA